MTTPSTHREFERKVRVTQDFQLAELPSTSLGTPREQIDLRATYHDTDDLSLLRWGVTLRRREGGDDQGWHLKLPVAGSDGSQRDEVHLPLDAGDIGAVPAQFVHIVSPLIGERTLVPLVEVRTARTAYDLLDADLTRRAELVDDIVSITRGGKLADSFRELEVEAVDADDAASRAMVEAVVAELVKHGATPSSVSKAAQALGARAGDPADVPDLPMVSRNALAVDAIRAILARHVRHLILADVAVRRDLPDSVHQCRVAARRLRSTFTAFKALLDTERIELLSEELAWLARELGALRDSEVLLERLLDDADDLEGESRTAATDAISDHLGRRMHAARSSVTAALRSDRHQELIEDLVAMVATPPVTDLAYFPADQALLPVFGEAWNRLTRTIQRLEISSPSTDWHAARIKAKRTRYVAEALVDLFGKPMRKIARELSEVTDALGIHQDAHVAQVELERIARASDGLAAFALGRLHEHEVDSELLVRIEFPGVWKNARRKVKASGLL